MTLQLSDEEMTRRVSLVYAMGKIADRSSREENGCAIWQGSKNSRGYGLISIRGKVELTHRVIWEAYHDGERIPEGMTVDHLCKTKACVNPEHMEIVSRSENSRRGGKAAPVVPRCENGHARVGGNAASVAADCTKCRRALPRSLWPDRWLEEEAARRRAVAS